MAVALCIFTNRSRHNRRSTDTTQTRTGDNSPAYYRLRPRQFLLPRGASTLHPSDAMPEKTRQVSIAVDASQSLGPLPPFSLFFGCDEPNYVTYPHGSALMKNLGALAPEHGQVFFRAHNLLTTGDEANGLAGVPGLKWGSTSAYTEDESGNPVYRWDVVDGILDAHLANGVRPYLQVGFMPRALAVDSEPYFFKFEHEDDPLSIFTGWTHPPRSYERWEELVYEWIRHCVDRYGPHECSTWWYECWNEADQPYWSGSQEDFFRLHDHTVHAVRRALPNARVGGPDLAVPTGGKEWLEAFIEHCLNGVNYATGQKGTPLDFLSWHAKGRPVTIQNQDVRMDVAAQLRTIDKAMQVVSRYPQLKGIPIILGEYDPDSCAAFKGNGYQYRNSLLYSSYTAMSFVRALDLANVRGINLHGIITWAFEFEASKIDPGETAYFDDYRTLSTQGIDKSVLNVHRMMAKMANGTRIAARSDGQLELSEVVSNSVRDQTDVGCMACQNGLALYVLVWHYHDEKTECPDAEITLSLKDIPPELEVDRSGDLPVRHYRVDKDHSDPFEAWKRMGSPQPPSTEQIQILQAKSKLATAEPDSSISLSKGSAQLTFTLPIRGVSLLVIGNS